MHMLPDAGWCEEENSEPAECLDWSLVGIWYTMRGVIGNAML